MAKARQQYFADEVTLQKESREFAIEPELVEKLDSIETGAQVNVIETVKVNGEALVPDEDKAVDIDVPLVEDDLYGTDNDAALSARQGRVLYDYIQNIQSRGRYLSNWNCATGLAMTNPSDNPYDYRAGDYYIVSNVSSGTNYRPDGAQYIINQASTTVETEIVKVSDSYIYDGTTWVLLVNTEREIAVDSSLSTTSTNPVENRVITNALNTKQDILIAGANIQIAADGKTISATDTTYSSLPAAEGGADVSLVTTGEKYTWNGKQDKLIAGNNISIAADGKTISAVDTTYSNLPAAQGGTDVSLVSTGDKYIWNNKQDTLIAGTNIQIAADGKTVSATDTTYTAGTNVSIDANNVISATDTTYTAGANISIDANNEISAVDTTYSSLPAASGGTDVSLVTTGEKYIWDNKQDELIAGTNIQIAADGKTISATDTTYVAGDFDIKDLADSTGLRTEWSGKQDALIAGTNIQIASDGKTISAIDTTYTAGANVSISNNNVISATDNKATWGNITGTLADQTDLNTALGGKQDTLTAGSNVTIENICSNDMQGPAPDGFHVPLNTEWTAIKNIRTALGGGGTDGTNFGITLKIPMAGYRSNSSASINYQGTDGYYWSSSCRSTTSAYNLNFSSYALSSQNYNARGLGAPIRCFKDVSVIPTSSWTKLYGTSIEVGGIFWSSVDGLISLSSDGSNWITIQDKNLGATAVYNDGDTLTQTNMGNMYQWGNNYGFPSTGTITNTSSTKVDASNYGPGNYYSSDTFITGSGNRSSVQNDNLWGGVSQGQSCALTISSHDTTYTAGTGISIDANNVISNTQTSAEWGNITGTLSDQTDLNTALGGKQDTLIAGTNIQIAADGKTISATDTTYTAGTGIDITNGVISNTQTSAEWGSITGTLADQSDLKTELDKKMENLVFLSYGVSTWADFEAAYGKNVYCRASSNSNPAQGDQTRCAFMAYINNPNISSATEVEFQYYRSVATHSYSTQGDEVFVYKLNKNTGRSVTKRNAYTKIAAGTNMSSSYNNGTLTLSATDTTYNTATSSTAGIVKLGSDTLQTEAAQSASSTAGRTYPVQLNSSDQMVVNVPWEDTQTGSATSSAAGTVKLFSDTVQTETAQSVSSTVNRTYGIQNNSSNQMVVNVPWTDTTYSNGTYLTLNGTTFDVDTSLIATKSDLANFAGFQVVATLPTSDIKTNIIYLLGPFTSVTGGDKYEEWIYSNNNWIMIGETSVDLSPYFNYTTQTSDAITEGSTNLFLTSAERTILDNTSNTNTGDETKTTIQTKLGAASASNSGYLTSTDWSTFNSKQNALTAGDNIDITNNVISATGLQNKLTAGDNITITENCESDMQGPCDSGFHVPLKSEWEGLKTIMTSLSLTTGAQYKTNLHMPFVGYRAYSDGLVRNQANSGDYWASNIEAAGRQNAYYMSLYSSDRNIEYNYFGYGYSIRAFKNEYVAPTSSWTVIAGTLGNAGIFWDSTDGLITVTNGTTGYTIQDKNVGATTVYNDGDTLSEANMGNLFQRGNNYGFSSSTSVTPTTSTTQVDTSSYGPENPYYSSTYIIDNKNWQSTTNGDLWGGESLGTHCQSTISSNANYIAGNNVTIEEVCESDMRGPAPSGYHVPSISEMNSLCGILTTTFSLPNKAVTMGTYLKMPMAGFRVLSDASIDSFGSGGMYWTSSPEGGNDAYVLNFSSSGIYPQTYQYRSYGFSIRCFKNSPVIPDSSWTPLYQGMLADSGVFWNSTDGLISISGDGFAWITIADKNLGATTVYNYGDTLTDANCGGYFQWGNNYMFPAANSSETITTSSTQVDVSGYGPGNYYSSSTWITIYTWQDATSDGTNLWGGVTQGTQCGNMISATDTTYESKTAASGGTDVSLVTTGEKYTWNNKANASDITTKTYYTTGTMSVETFMDILNGLAANHIAPIIVYASNTTDIYYYDTGNVATTSVSLYFYAPSNGVSNGTLYNKKLTVTYNMTAGTVTLTKSNESLAVGGGDMSYSDFGRQAKTGATITLDLASTYTPSANFTVNAPSTIKDGQTYILRVNNGSTAYTMTLGTNVTNPFGTSLALTANGIDQFVFLAIGGNLELQPEGGGGGIAPAANSPINVKYIWAGTQAQYEALSSYDDNTVYLTV